MFGEIGLLTGMPGPGRVSALTPATAYELAKSDLGPILILKPRPQVTQKLCRQLAQRQAARQMITGSGELDETIPRHRLTDWFAERLHRLRDVVAAG